MRHTAEMQRLVQSEAEHHCYKALANHFIENTALEEYETKAMCCWYLYLNEAITADFTPEAIVLVGRLFLENPYQFSAYIVWLLDKEISPYAIVKSKLLHRYFCNYADEPSELSHTYQLIENFTSSGELAELIKNFIKFTSTTPCCIDTYTNSSSKGKYGSHSVDGKRFLHEDKFETLKINALDNIIESSSTILVLENKEILLVKQILKTIAENIKENISMLQEAIFYSQNLAFSEAIITFMLENYDAKMISSIFHESFFHELFYDENYLFDYIAKQEDVKFREWAFSVIPITDEIIISAIKRAKQSGSLAEVHLFQSACLSPAAALEAIKQLFREEYKDKQKWAWLERRLNAMGHNAFSKELIGTIFNIAIEDAHQDRLIKFICSYPDKEKFPDNFVQDSAMTAMQYNNWSVVRILCGLSSEMINQAIISKNNIELFMMVLKKRTESAEPREYLTDIEREIYRVDQSGNTLFHLAAHSGCYEAAIKTINFFAEHLCPRTVEMFLHAKNGAGEIPRCPADMPLAEEINEFLAEKRSYYNRRYHFAPPDGTLWHYREDRKRRRELPGLFRNLSDDDEPENKGARTETVSDLCAAIQRKWTR